MIQIWSFCAGRKPSCGGFLLMCALKNLLLWVICVQRKNSLSTGLVFVRLLVFWIISAHGCILRTYADIANNDFGLPTLDYLRTQASTLGHGCFLRRYADIPKNDSGLPMPDYLRI